MNNMTKLAAALVLACAVPAGALLAADKPAKPAAKTADAKPSPAADDAAKAAAPKLQMARANPGRNVDLRHCLDLGTNSEIIRCAERGDRKE
jgi:hypothetical protein